MQFRWHTTHIYFSLRRFRYREIKQIDFMEIWCAIISNPRAIAGIIPPQCKSVGMVSTLLFTSNNAVFENELINIEESLRSTLHCVTCEQCLRRCFRTTLLNGNDEIVCHMCVRACARARACVCVCVYRCLKI